MTRKKVKLAWIVNDKVRKSTFQKRKENLFKKMNELTILCAIHGFIIVYGADDDELTVWPSRQVVEKLVTRFQGVSKIDRYKKMINQEAYYKEKVAKLQEELKKIRKTNNQMEMDEIMHEAENGKPLDEFQTNELTGLVSFLEEKMKEIGKWIEYKERDLTLFYPSQGGAEEKINVPNRWNPTESLFDDLRKEKGKQIENMVNFGGCSSMASNMTTVSSSNNGVMSDMGLSLHGYFGNTSNIHVPNDTRLMHENFSGNVGYAKSDFGMSGENFSWNNNGINMGSFYENENFSWNNNGINMGSFYENFGVTDDGSCMIPALHMDYRMLQYLNANGSSNNVLGNLPYDGSIRGPEKDIIGLPYGLFGNSSGGSDAGGQFGGSNNGGDVGVPYDVYKTW